MFGIVTKNLHQDFEQAIEESNAFYWDGSSIREQLDSAARVHIRTLIIDIEAAPIDELIMGLRSFRRQRPNTRIIVFGFDRQPGDASIGRIFAQGIYDIVVVQREDREEEELSPIIVSAIQEKLQAPVATYADAAKWDVLSEEITSSSAKQKKGSSSVIEKVRETVVIQERLIGTPVIAVIGAHAGAGTTYCSLQMSQAFLQYGSVAYVELTSTRGFTTTETEEPSIVDGIDVWRLPSLNSLPPKYNYIVLNTGYWPNRTDEVKNEIRRASKTFVTVGSSIWRYREFADQIDSILETREDWNILLQFPSDRQLKEIRKDVSKLNWPLFAIPYQPEPLELSDESEQVFEEALQMYMPKKASKPSFLSKIFSRRRLTEGDANT